MPLANQFEAIISGIAEYILDYDYKEAIKVIAAWEEKFTSLAN